MTGEITSRQFAALDPRNAKGYGRQEIPISKDEELRSFIRRIRNSEDFNSVLSVQPAGSWMVLDAFAERIASLAVRRQDVRELRDALMAAQLALALTDDSREVLPTLSLLFRACQLIGEDPVVEFRASAHAVRASPDGEFMKFLGRSPEDQSIGAMGFEEGNDAAGFRFQRNW